MTTNIGELVFKNSDFPLLTETVMTQEGIYKDGNDISFTNILILKDVLPSLRIPPNINTLKVDNTILLDDGSTTSSELNSTYLKVENTSTQQITLMDSNTGLQITDNFNMIGSILSHSFLSVDASPGGGPTSTLSTGDLTINDFGSNAITQLTADYLNISIPASALTAQLSPYELQISNGGLSTDIQITDKQFLFNDNSTSIQTEISNDVNVYAEPFIRMRNTTGNDNYYYRSGINADGHNNFYLENNNSFFRQNNPFSMRVYQLNDGDYIEKNYPFVYCYNLTVVKLYNPVNYLDDNGNDGWSCIVSNHSDVDINIDTAGFDWYAHSSAQQSNPINLKKWATCRITLINSINYGNYIWAVSQF